MNCPVTNKKCARDCGEQIFCELMSLKLEKPDVELEHGRSYFIESHRLGAIEHVMHMILRDGNKRNRRIELNHVEQVLKTLKLIPHSEKIIALGLGCLDNGTSGLFVLCTSPIHIQGDIPSAKT